MRTVIAVRDEGRDYTRHMIHSSFIGEGEEVTNAVADILAHFGMVGFDGAFTPLRSGDVKPISEFIEQLADAMVTIGDTLIAGR